MSQNIANLASARKELAQRKDEVAQCTAELKAARELMATGGSGPKTLTVTIKEIFGDITVDRMSIRPDKTAEIEKVVVEGIPCQFSLEAEVKNFDLVFMAEHSPGDDATAPDAANDERKNGEQTAPAAKPVEEVEVDKVVMSAAASTDAVRAKTETEAPASTIDTIEEAELQVASTGNTIDSSGSSVESGAQPVIDGSVVAIEPPVSGANQAVVEVEAVTAGVGNAVETVVGDEAVDTIEGKGEASPLTEGEIAADTTSVDAVKSEGDLKGEKPGVIEGGVSASDGVLSGAAVEKEPAKRMGCSTVTTPLVVPSTELDMKSTEGQWRFLEVPPESEFVNGAIEVTKGVRFSTSLEGHNKMEDESRISELTIMLDEAEQRVRSADAMVEKLKPAASGSSTRKKPTSGGGNRKSALKKGKTGARSLKGDVGKGKGAVGVLSSTFGKFYGNAKLVGNAGWRSRNLLFFISAVVVIHYHGDYLAV